MAKIKPLTDIADKWSTITPGRTTEYQRGVQNPLRDWLRNTEEAVGRFAAAIRDAANADRFAQGVRRVGDSKWQNRTIDVGVDRWGPGVQAAGQDYEAGFAPFREVIARVDLPPRFPTGDLRNIDRVRAIATALHTAKLGR